MPTYEGPAANVQYKGRWYQPGDNIPMTKDEVDRMLINGHHFEGHSVVAENGVVLAVAPEPAPVMPYDDRGQQITLPAPRATAESASGGRPAEKG